MSALTVDSVNIPVRAVGGATQQREDQGVLDRSLGGYARSDVTAGLGRALSWSIETPPLQTSDATTVRNALTPTGTVTVDGTLFSAAATALITGLSETPSREGYTVFRFNVQIVATE